MSAPEVSASGQGLVAERIIELAKENNVPVREDPTLAGLLSQLEVGDVIPPQLYGAVAEVLAFVYRLEGKKLDAS
jgi:flagellar biosynthesis protein